MARSWAGLRRLWPAAAGFGGLSLAWLVWRLASGGERWAATRSSPTPGTAGRAAKYVVYHLADLLILCGRLPALRVAALLVRALRRGEPDRACALTSAVASSVVGLVRARGRVFASRYSDRLVERNLIALAPVLFVGSMLWLERGAPHDYVVAGGRPRRCCSSSGQAAVTVSTTHDAMTRSRSTGSRSGQSAGTIADRLHVAAVLLVARSRSAWAAAAGNAGCAPRRRDPRLSRRKPVRRPRGSAQQRTFLGDDPSGGLDHAVPDKRSSTSTTGAVLARGVGDLFWNDHIDRVYDLGTPVPGPCRRRHAQVGRRRAACTPARGQGIQVRGRIDLVRARRRAQGPRSSSRA